ncbi:putative F-box protein [Cardamine amara subsp. amara]|uniref:F-box protein n=1 Tax=Cardamine amara subsp. amara TaxID=228776 RepID=A0ABD1AN68_CARAN
MNRCMKEINEEAIYRKGLRLYFDQDYTENIREEGLGLMAQASDDGNLEVIYVYGLILLCLCGDRVALAFSILSPLIKPLLSTTLKEVEILRVENVFRLWWYFNLITFVLH